jgi:hypothetical protein
VGQDLAERVRRIDSLVSLMDVLKFNAVTYLSLSYLAGLLKRAHDNPSSVSVEEGVFQTLGTLVRATRESVKDMDLPLVSNACNWALLCLTPGRQ